jgi:hypothetical protein
MISKLTEEERSSQLGPILEQGINYTVPVNTVPVPVPALHLWKLLRRGADPHRILNFKYTVIILFFYLPSGKFFSIFSASPKAEILGRDS